MQRASFNPIRCFKLSELEQRRATLRHAVEATASTVVREGRCHMSDATPKQTFCRGLPSDKRLQIIKPRSRRSCALVCTHGRTFWASRASLYFKVIEVLRCTVTAPGTHSTVGPEQLPGNCEFGRRQERPSCDLPIAARPRISKHSTLDPLQ